MSYTSSFSRTSLGSASPLSSPLSDDDSKTLSDTTIESDPGLQMNHIIGGNSSVLPATLASFPNVLHVFGEWLSSPHFPFVGDNCTETMVRSVTLSRKSWDKIREFLTTTNTSIPRAIRFTYFEAHEVLVLKAMTEAHAQAAWDFPLFSANDLKGSVGSPIADVVQLSESSRTFKATTEDGGVVEQIPDLVARIRPLWVPTQTISIHERYVVAGTTDCFRVEVCNSEDVLHGINKNTAVGVPLPEKTAKAGAGEASQARTSEEERTGEETSKDESSGDKNSDEETSEDVFKVLAKIPLFIINFESSKIPPDLKPDAATRSSATQLWVADPQSPRAACGPIAWGGKLRTGDTLVQLLVFSGQEAIDCLREGAKANWPVESYIEKGYGCHIVDEYNTPELQAEHQRFWPHFVSAVQTVRMFATTAYMRFRISQLKKENPTMSSDQLTSIAMPEGKHYAEKTTAPVTDPLPTFAASLQQAIVSEQLKKMDHHRLQQCKKRKRGVSPQIIGGDGADVAARLASPRHEQYVEDMGNWVREMVKKTCDKDAGRRVKQLKDSRAKVFLGADATTAPEVGP